MPWKETSVMNVRTEFVLRVFEAKVPFNDLCKEFGIEPDLQGIAPYLVDVQIQVRGETLYCTPPLR